MNFIFNNHIENPYLNIYCAGFDQTSPGYRYGPTMRSGFMLHYIYSGKGTFICNNKKYHLQAGDFFFIDPEATIEYIADNFDPWAFYYVGFRGPLAATYLSRTSITKNNPTFNNQKEGEFIRNKFSELIQVSLISEDNDMQLTAIIIEILYYMSQAYPRHKIESPENSRNILFNKAAYFLKNNFDSNIKISDLASYLNIDRSYLHKIFKKECGLSPKEFLTHVRISHAKYLLINTNSPIKIISNSVGIEDSSNFMKLFKQTERITPSEYRKHHTIE